MSFSNVLGHERQIAVLMRGITTGQLPPAYLFHGEEGIGKRLMALQFAKAVNCEGGAEPGSSCDACRPCRNIDAGCHPNVSMLEIEVNQDTGKPRQEIVIAQVRAAQEFLSLKAVGEGRKVLIVDGAHLINEEGANALLKTLEEPPEGTHVIMVTSRPSFLLPTILSRCRAVSFQPIAENLVAGLLTGRKGMKPDEASFVARMTGGRVGAALEADPAELAESRKVVLELLSYLGKAGPSSIIKKAEEVSKDLSGLSDLVHFGTMWFRDVLVILVGGDFSLAYNSDMAVELKAWATGTTAYRAESALSLLKETGRALERTFNRRLMAEDLFFKLKEEALARPGPQAGCTI